MNESIQQIILAYQKLKSEKFPDHVCAQANSISRIHLHTCDLAHKMKYADDGIGWYKDAMKQNIINTAAQCIRMIDELEK